MCRWRGSGLNSNVGDRAAALHGSRKQHHQRTCTSIQRCDQHPTMPVPRPIVKSCASVVKQRRSLQRTPGPSRDTHSSLVLAQCIRRHATSSWALPVRDSARRVLKPEIGSLRSGSRLEMVSWSQPLAPPLGSVTQLALSSASWRCRLPSQRALSKGCWLWATARIIGTSLRATAQTALVLHPPLRATSAS